MSCIVYTVSYNLTTHVTYLLTFMAYKYSELQGKLQNSPFSHSEPICKHNYSNIGGAIFLIKKCFFSKGGYSPFPFPNTTITLWWGQFLF